MFTAILKFLESCAIRRRLRSSYQGQNVIQLMERLPFVSNSAIDIKESTTREMVMRSPKPVVMATSFEIEKSGEGSLTEVVNALSRQSVGGQQDFISFVGDGTEADFIEDGIMDVCVDCFSSNRGGRPASTVRIIRIGRIGVDYYRWIRYLKIDVDEGDEDLMKDPFYRITFGRDNGRENDT